MIAVDYFCGAGGASLGLHEAGYRVVGYDNWPIAVGTHNLNGMSAHVADLSNEVRDSLYPMEPDVAWFSPPCPPFSAAGSGDGHLDPRDGFPWALRIIRVTKPKVVFIENVKGLVSKRHKAYFESILMALRCFGYDVDWRVLNCANYGVPQTRERCFTIARCDGKPIVWPEPTHTKEQWVSMAEALGWGFDGPARTIAGNRTPRWAYEQANSDKTGQTLVGFPRRADEHESIEVDGVEYRARDLFPADGPAPTLTEKGRSWNRYVLNTGRDWKPGEDRESAQAIGLDNAAPTVTALSGRQWQVRAGNDSRATVRSIDEPAPTVLSRKDPNGWTLERPATTVQADDRIWPPGHKMNAKDIAAGRPLLKRASAGVIKMTIDELAILQDFPEGFTFLGNRTQQCRQVGNAVPPTMALALAQANQ